MAARRLQYDAVRGGFRLSAGIGVWALTALFFLAVIPAPADAKRRTCSKAGSTITASAGARVYSLPPRDGFEYVYACRYRTGRRVLLGTRGDCQNQAQVRHATLAGAFVGYSIHACGLEDLGSSSIAVVDLRTRRRVRSARAVGPPPPGVTEVTSSVAELVLKANGSVAWIGVAEHSSGSESTRVSELRKSDADGEALVDSGGSLSALALARSTLYWTKDGQAFAAALR